MELQKLRIGTRSSRLALIQTELIVVELKKRAPELEIEVKTIATKGDTDHSPIPLDTIGKAWFTSEIEEALSRRDIDLAVHSLKDVMPEIPKGLATFPVLTREDPRDVLVSKKSVHLAQLHRGAIIGTDSLRRKALLLQQRPDVNIKSIRGNVETRVQKLRDEDYDGIVIAAAGLKRLGLIDVATEFFDPTTFVPAIGQGVLAAEIRKDERELEALLVSIQDENTCIANDAEQAFSREVGGGCKLPIGCYAHVKNGKVLLHGMLGSMDGRTIERLSAESSREDAVSSAKHMAQELLIKIPLHG